MTIRIVDFKSFKDAIKKYDELAPQDNQKITIDFSHKDRDTAARMAKFFEVADGNGNPEWNV
ncbi:hypothetical protein J6P92_04415 [bacterium]|nr:hypothetical protein [bacterium]